MHLNKWDINIQFIDLSPNPHLPPPIDIMRIFHNILKTDFSKQYNGNTLLLYCLREMNNMHISSSLAFFFRWLFDRASDESKVRLE